MLLRSGGIFIIFARTWLNPREAQAQSPVFFTGSLQRCMCVLEFLSCLRKFTGLLLVKLSRADGNA